MYNSDIRLCDGYSDRESSESIVHLIPMKVDSNKQVGNLLIWRYATSNGGQRCHITGSVFKISAIAVLLDFDSRLKKSNKMQQ